MKNNQHTNLVIITIVTLLFCANANAQPTFSWAKAMGGSIADGGYSIALDASGNVYSTGWFTSTADFDPGAATFNLTSAGYNDIFISKLDAAGNFVWAKAMGGTDDEAGYSMVIDASGNVYITGWFKMTCDFDPGAGTYNLASAGLADIFISKLDAAGNFVWAKRMGGANYDASYSIALDDSGNVYTTGIFQGTADFDPGAGTFNLTSVGVYDIFILKLDATGNFVWAKTMGGTSNEGGNSIALDASGNVFTTGIFQGTADFDPGAGTFNLTSAGDDDIFISKLDAAGNFVWAKRMGGISYDVSYSIALDASGNAFTAGSFYDTVDFDPGAGTYNLASAGLADIFISKLDAAGNFVWAKAMGEPSNDWANSIALDTYGNVFTTGSFMDTVDFDPGTGTYNLASAGIYDIFISKLDAAGNFVWAKAMGGTSSEGGRSIALDSSGNVFTTGGFAYTADFDPGAGTFNLTSAGNSDIFVHKMGDFSVEVVENSIVNTVTIYPNPTNEKIFISLIEKFKNVSVYLVNPTGQIIMEKNNIIENSFIFDISELANGIYFFHVKTENEFFVKKIIKQ